MPKGYSIVCAILICVTGHSFAQITPPAGVGNNIVLWLSPDTAVYRNTSGTPANTGQRVREWHDISGNGYVFVNSGGARRPRFITDYGRPMLDFVNGDYMESVAAAGAVNGMTEFSVYAVIKSDRTNTDNGFLDSENPDGSDDFLCMRYDANGANTGRTNLIKCGMQGNTPNNQIESQSNTQTTSIQVLTLTWRQGEPINLYIDGVLNESSVNSMGGAMSGITRVLLGRAVKNTGATSGWDGSIGTVIFYNRKFNADTVGLISADLKAVKSIQTGNWTTASTWDCNCVPSANDDVRIQSGHTVTLTQNETVGSVIIDAGGTLNTSGSSFGLDINRNFIVNGTFQANTGTVTFSGTAPQILGGMATGAFRNITLNNTAGLDIHDSNKDVFGTLDVQNGCVTTNGLLTMRSDASGTARIGALTGGACVSGNVTFERYINAGQTNWRFFSSPINGATLAGWNDNFITSGIPGSDFPNWPTVSNPWPSIYTYDESQSGDRNTGFVAATSMGQMINPGEGFWVWCGDTITGTQPFTIDQTGPINSGNISLPVSYTNTGSLPDDGWSMIGNPYPSTIDWDSPNWTKSGLDNAVYIWDPDNQVFASYVSGIGTNGGSRFIPSSQSFWVKANSSSPTLTITENTKSATDQAYFKTKVQNVIRIGLKNTIFPSRKDEVVFRFMQGRTDTYESDVDAVKFYSSNANIPMISTTSGGDALSISTLDVNANKMLPVNVKINASGSYTFDFLDVVGAHQLSCAFFVDTYTGKEIDMKVNTSYKCTLYDTTKATRFYVKLGTGANVLTNKATCQSISNGAVSYVPTHGVGPWDFTWTNVNGDTLQQTFSAFQDQLSGVKPGDYFAHLAGNDFCGAHFSKITVGDSLNMKANFILANDTVTLGQPLAVSNTSTQAAAYLYDFGDGSSSTNKNPVHTYGAAGNYNLELTVTNGLCKDSLGRSVTVVEPTFIARNPEQRFSIYPNPSRGVVKLEMGQETGTVAVRDLAGKQLVQLPALRGLNTINLKLPAGNYLITVKSSTGWTENHRVVITD